MSPGQGLAGADGPRVVDEPLGELPQQGVDPVGLGHGLGAQVDALVVEGPERGQRIGLGLAHADPAGLGDGLDHGGDEAAELGAAPVAHHLDDLGGQVDGGDHAGVDGVLEVVADVGDAVGPGHDLALGRGRGRAGSRSGCGRRRASRRRG